MEDRLDSCKQMTLVEHSCEETSVAADESGIHTRSWMNLVRYARASVFKTSSLTRQ